MRQQLSVSVIDTAAELAAYREEWNRLLDNASQRSICLRWEWLHTWWTIFSDCGIALQVILVREEERIVGMAPLFYQVEKKFGIIPVRTLRFLGTGEPEWEEVASEYLDIVAHAGYETRVVQAVWTHLRQQRTWDQIVFNDVLENSLIVTTLAPMAAAEHLPVMLNDVGIRYYVGLPRTWDAYIGMLEAGAAKRLPYKRRKFERAGRVADKKITDSAELDKAFDELIRLHTARWKARGHDGVFASARFTDFHRKIARLLLPLGMLNIRLLSLDEVNIAVLYNFRFAGTDYFYQGGFDMESAAKHSPGILAHVYAIDGALGDGLQYYDFMKGGVVSYKTEFGCHASPMRDVRIFADTYRGKFLAWKNNLYERLRRLKREMRKPVAVADTNLVS